MGKNTLVDDEVIAVLRRNRQSLDEKVIKYFLGQKSIYEKDQERSGVLVESIKLTPTKNKLKLLKVMIKEKIVFTLLCQMLLLV